MHFLALLSSFWLLSTEILQAEASQNRRFAGQWSTLPSIPVAPRQEHSTVALGSEIYILGGILPNRVMTPIVQAYNTINGTWRDVAPLPISVNHANAVVVNGNIFVLGGLIQSPDGAWRTATNISFVYSPERNEWTKLGDIPIAHSRGSAALGVHGHLVYLAGGMTTLVPTGPGGEQDTVDVVSAYDTLTDSWIDLPTNASTIPEGRDHAGKAVVGDTLYVLGGRLRGQLNVRDTVFALNLNDVAAGWVTRAGRMPTARGGVSSATVGTKVYVFGGEGDPEEASGVFNQTEVYDTVTDTWEKLAPMTFPVHGTSAVGVLGRAYIPGGGTVAGGSEPTDTFQVFIP
ncbi:galactose oxidase [Marasmius fiardii PR-910]|nr:galactose oxidase [Marasmius fiardii PR-910]